MEESQKRSPIARSIAPHLERDLATKMVFLSGARQAGKTTLARQLARQRPGAQVFNWDVLTDRRVMMAQSWAPTAPMPVFDELHKMKGWRDWLKGVFDGRAPGQAILVTGSARLDAFRQTGESLAGRYFAWHLNPVTISEFMAATSATAEDALSRILARGGFPEPLLAQRVEDADRWRWKLDAAMRFGGFGPWRPEWSLYRLAGLGVPFYGMLVEIEEEMGWGTSPEDVMPYIPEGGRLEILAGVGHFAHIEQPDEVAGRILDFLGAPA